MEMPHVPGGVGFLDDVVVVVVVGTATVGDCSDTGTNQTNRKLRNQISVYYCAMLRTPRL